MNVSNLFRSGFLKFSTAITLSLITSLSLATPTTTRQLANPLPQANQFNAVSYNSTLTTSVAVGDNGSTNIWC